MCNRPELRAPYTNAQEIHTGVHRCSCTGLPAWSSRLTLTVMPKTCVYICKFLTVDICILHIRAYLYVCMCMYTYTCTHTSMCVCICVCTHIHVQYTTYIYILHDALIYRACLSGLLSHSVSTQCAMYSCAYMHLPIHTNACIYTHTHKQVDLVGSQMLLLLSLPFVPFAGVYRTLSAIGPRKIVCRYELYMLRSCSYSLHTQHFW
jgi:hypothetical protein